MKNNIIDFLNSSVDAGDVLIISIIALAVWVILWHLVFYRFLKRCKVTSFWYAMYQLGAVGTFSILIFLSFIAILLIASIQAVLHYGAILLLPLIVFWGGLIAVATLIIRHIRKEKRR